MPVDAGESSAGIAEHLSGGSGGDGGGGGGVTSSAPAPPRGMPPAAAADLLERPPKAHRLLLDQSLAGKATVSQAVVVGLQWARAVSGEDRSGGSSAVGSLAFPACLLLINAVILLCMLRWPAQYWKRRCGNVVAQVLPPSALHHTPGHPLAPPHTHPPAPFAPPPPTRLPSHRIPSLLMIRCAVVLVPSMRQTGVGSALALERTPPGAGWAGAVWDALRVAGGVRMLPLTVISFATMMPPTATLAMQAITMAFTANSRGYCDAPLLAHPLSGRRIDAVARALEYAFLPIAALQPTFDSRFWQSSVLTSASPAPPPLVTLPSVLDAGVG